MTKNMDVRPQEDSMRIFDKLITSICVIVTAFAAWFSFLAAKQANEISQEANEITRLAIEYHKEQDRTEMKEKIRPVLRFQKEYAVYTVSAKDLVTSSVGTNRDREFGDMILRNFGNGPAIECYLYWTIYNTETNKLLVEDFRTKLPNVDIADDEQVSVMLLPDKLFDVARTKGTITIRCKDKNRNKVSSAYDFSGSWSKDEDKIELNMLLNEKPKPLSIRELLSKRVVK